MGMVHGPNLVTDGLVMYYDVGNAQSYPGSGDTWYDLSGSGTNATLYGAALSGTHMDFDGTDDYALMTPVSAGTEWTFSVWAQSDVTDGAWHDFYDEQSGHRHTFALYSSTGKFMMYDNNYRYSTFTLTDNNWHHYVVTQITGTYVFYVDGVSYGTGVSAGFQLGGDPAMIGAYLPSLPTPTIEEWNGFMDIMMIHNKKLTAAEVLQNYNAHKSRFGL